MIYIRPNQKITKEYLFLKDFLSSDFFNNNKYPEKYNYTLIEEPFTGFGYPDLVCIIWDKSMRTQWDEKRNKLTTTDIKILHHLYISSNSKNIDELITELGFSKKVILNSLDILCNINLIKEMECFNFKTKPLKNIFFIKEIITIEAKLKDWKRALEQSINNTYFSSKSYSLFPENTISEKLLNSYKNTSVGIISYKNNYKIIKNPDKNVMPSNITTWFMHEYIGRTKGVNYV